MPRPPSPCGVSSEVERLDRQIDRDEMDIDALVLRILALRQPVAFDLRFLATALKLVTDLERIADHATNIAEEVIFLVDGDDVRHVRSNPPPRAEER